VGKGSGVGMEEKSVPGLRKDDCDFEMPSKLSSKFALPSEFG
jgi:hypothetical protein